MEMMAPLLLIPGSQDLGKLMLPLVGKTEDPVTATQSGWVQMVLSIPALVGETEDPGTSIIVPALGEMTSTQSKLGITGLFLIPRG